MPMCDGVIRTRGTLTRVVPAVILYLSRCVLRMIDVEADAQDQALVLVDQDGLGLA